MEEDHINYLNHNIQQKFGKITIFCFFGDIFDKFRIVLKVTDLEEDVFSSAIQLGSFWFKGKYYRPFSCFYEYIWHSNIWVRVLTLLVYSSTQIQP